MKKLLLIAFLATFVNVVNAQILTPVKWSYAAKRLNKSEAVVFLKATMQPGWHIYSQNVNEGGPIPTSFVFQKSKAFQIIGKTIEPKPLEKFEKTFAMNVKYFKNSVVFQQKVKVAATSTKISGTLEFMACNDSKCLPPEEVQFSIVVK